jgi:hypothetical protein
MRAKRWLPLAGVFVAVTGVAWSIPKVGAKPADATVQDFAGEQKAKLSAIRGGRPMLIHFWASW